MHALKYFTESLDQINGIESVYENYADIIFSDKFIERFEDVPGYSSNMLGIPLHLWKKYKSEYFITIEDFREEFIRCVGLARFQEEIEKCPDEFEKSFQIVQNFCDEAAKEYYSGFLGKLRSLFRGRKKHKEVKQIDFL